MVGRTLGHYRILEKIGAGGMGEVYRAHDERLKRDVAIKVLPPGTLNDEAARKRFRKEALALAQLNHPNIETIYDFDTDNGVDFLVMEYLSGRTLAEELAAGPLTEKQIARLGGHIAAALEEAHEHGVVHCDLKPGNVLITERGLAKVLDFGLAKLVRPSSESSITASVSDTGVTGGTLAYMSPEQVNGEKVDARSDIWSMGVVLYEMAVGQRPFRGTPTRVIEAILHESPPGPRTLNFRVSPALGNVILKAMNKEPAMRYQTAREIGAVLEGIQTGPATPGAVGGYGIARSRLGIAAIAAVALLAALAGVGSNVGGLRDRLFGPPRLHIRSLAVLPLTNLSGEADKEYLADGITESLLTALGQFSGLRVISRTSVMQYKASHKPVREIAKELRVDAVLEGSVLYAEDQVQITARLIHAETDTQLWSQSYQRRWGDILALHNEVAREIGRRVQLTLTPQHEKHLAAAHPILPESYRAYLRGRYHWNRYEFNKALEEFRQAIRLDPSYPLAYVGLADTYYSLSGLYEPPQEAIPKARAGVMKALELDDSIGEAHASLANIQMSYDWDWLAAKSSFDRALERYPNYAQARIWYGTYLLYAARPDEAVEQFEQALELDPLSPTVASFTAWALYNAGRYDDAIRQARATIELEPSFFPAYLSLGLAYQQKGMQSEALAAYEKALSLSQGHPVQLLLRAQVLQKLGRAGEATAILENSKQTASDNPAATAYHIAQTYCLLGNADEAFAWLEKAYQARSEEMLILQVDPKLQTLRSDPRFQNLLRRMNFPQ